MIFSYHSGFADDINSMIEFKKALGRKAKGYEWGLLSFDRFCQIEFSNACELTKEIVLSWCNDAKENGASNYRMHIMREFGKYLISIEKKAFVLPAKLIPPYKVGIPYIFTDDELRRFFRATDEIPHDTRSPLLEYTAPTIFRLQFGCGLRPPEVRLLKRRDFNFSDGTVYISESKRRKDRRLALNEGLVKLCRRYDAIAQMHYPNRTYFFHSPNGGAYKSGWLTAQFHKSWEKAGLGNERGPCTPYDFRHNFATRTLMRWVEEDRDLEVLIPYLSAYMGHESFNSTYYYVHLLPERLANMDFTKANGIIPEVLS
ncbi:MAG: hypothetical protein A2017_00225 [Lentisphaerae bacterium GWF2_44_16]|nr:MAG: hypothetical protein A2017_00225 [Lentisphaerae bacterium GWF2_44_16]